MDVLAFDGPARLGVVLDPEQVVETQFAGGVARVAAAIVVAVQASDELPAAGLDDPQLRLRLVAAGRCQERFAVYGLAIYCPSCGRLAPAQQFGELLRIQQARLAALDAIPTEHKRQLAESGVLTANYESTIKDGFTALETYLKSRFIADAPTVSLVGNGVVFERLDEAAGLYTAHLAVDLRDLVGQKAWRDLLRIAAMRHVLTHNGGVVDVKFLEQVPDCPKRWGNAYTSARKMPASSC